MESATEGDREVRFRHWWCALPMIALVVVQVAFSFSLAKTWQGGLYDPDAYMRLVRAERLALGGSWWDGREPRSFPPEGETSHWSRPFDVLLLVGAAPLVPFIGWKEALGIWGWWISPMLSMACLLGLWWAYRDELDEAGRVQLGLLFLCQPVILLVFAPGRPDHHGLIVLMLVLLIGWTRRAIRAGADDWAWVWAGLWAGAACWVSVEMLAAAVVSGAAAVWPYLTTGDRGALGRGARFFGGAAFMTVFYRLVERAPGEWLLTEYDVLSRVHLTGLVLAAGSLAALRLLGGSWGRCGRLIALLVFGGLGLGVFLLSYPGLREGGLHGELPAELFERWMQQVREVQPVWIWCGQNVVGLTGLLAPVFLAIWGGWLEWRRLREGVERRLNLLFQVALVITFLGLSLWQVRWLPSALVACLVGCLAWWRGFLWWIHGWRFEAGWRMFGSVGLAAGLFLGQLWSLAGNARGEPRAKAMEFYLLGKQIASLPVPEEGGPNRVLSVPDVGPAILWLSKAEVISTPYHRNWRGILEAKWALGLESPAEFQAYLEQRGVTLVLVPSQDGANAGEVRTVGARLGAGEPMYGLEAVSLPEGLAEAWRLYRRMQVGIPGDGPPKREGLGS